MNKKYWNQLNLLGKLSDEFVKHLIRHSYNEVVKVPLIIAFHIGIYLYLS